MARHPAEKAGGSPGVICCVLLASGFGRRFGSNKLLYELNGTPLYLHALDMLRRLSKRRIDGQEIRVVVVSQYEEIETQACKLGAQAVHNPDAVEGIAASVRYGVQAAADAEWMAFFTADQPYLRAETVFRFLETAIHSGTSMASVISAGKPGNPTLFHRSRQQELLQLAGDVGGRSIMKRHPEQVFWFEIPEEERWDMDVLPGANQPDAVDKPTDFR